MMDLADGHVAALNKLFTDPKIGKTFNCLKVLVWWIRILRMFVM